MSDPENLISRASDGDAVSVRKLLDRHLPSVRAYVRLRMGKRVRRWETDSDVVQSVCVEVLGNLSGFEYRGEAAFKQWLFRAALRKLVEKDRHLTADKRSVDHMVTNADEAMSRVVQNRLGTPSQVAVGHELMERIERAMERMPEQTREVVLLSRLAGLNSRDIAEQLDMNRATVRKVLSRALTELAAAIAAA